ncbi:MAG: hypothetical protein KatS3mg127_1802 [Silanimonas sp.]|nr:MAG: hypothetical protein KatS3mg127_1802 [Silanimonas sp.]
MPGNRYLPPLAAALALALALPLPAATRDAAPVERLEAEAVGSLVIEPDGSVGEVTLPPELKPPIRSLYEEAIRGWTFQPIEVDGTVVRAVGHMRLDLYMDIQGTRLLSAGISQVDFIDPPVPGAPPVRPPAGLKMSAPRYPQSLAARGIGGQVRLQLETDATGRVQRVATRDGVLYARAEGAERDNTRRAFDELAEAAERAARRWVVPNCPGRCVVPVRFSVSRTPSFWKPVISVAHVPPPWVLEGDTPQALSANGDPYSKRIQPLGPTRDIVLFREEG